MFGELGIFEDNGEKVQCHVCGKWFKVLNNSHLMNHDLDALSYRQKFGLNMTQPLASTEARSRFRENCSQFIKPFMGKPSEKFLTRKRTSGPRRKQWHLTRTERDIPSKGGKARALKLTREQMSAIGKYAMKVRWQK